MVCGLVPILAVGACLHQLSIWPNELIYKARSVELATHLPLPCTYNHPSPCCKGKQRNLPCFLTTVKFNKARRNGNSCNSYLSKWNCRCGLYIHSCLFMFTLLIKWQEQGVQQFSHKDAQSWKNSTYLWRAAGRLKARDNCIQDMCMNIW